MANFIFEDESSSIQLTLFNQDLEKFEPLLLEGKCYRISHCDIKPASKFNKAKHCFELTGSKVIQIHPVNDI